MLNEVGEGGGGGLIGGGTNFRRVRVTCDLPVCAVFHSVGCMEHSDSLPDYKFDPEEHFDDVCVTGGDGANAACSAAVAHTSASVSNTKKQLRWTPFFK